jgi:hypothetical protein
LKSGQYQSSKPLHYASTTHASAVESHIRINPLLGSHHSITGSPSVHSYATSLNHQTHSSSHNNPHDPSGSSKSSSVIDHSSPTTTTDLNMNSRRRRSNMSIDSNETSYAPAQHASSSNTPMRPFPATASGESHVRLTPITRKISKAKKGVLVHNCDQCPKTFSRAEHLRFVPHPILMDISNSCEPDGINSAIHPLICIAISVVVTRGSTAKTFLIGMFRDMIKMPWILSNRSALLPKAVQRHMYCPLRKLHDRSLSLTTTIEHWLL